MKFLKAIKKTDAEQPSALAEDFADGGAELGGTPDPAEESIIDKDLTIGLPQPAKNGRGADALSADLEGRAKVSGTPASPGKPVAFVAASVPEFEVEPDRVNPHLVAINHPNSAFAEEYRSLRTQILQASQKQRLRSIVVASVGPGEGKSVTSLNLAWLLAQTAGIRTLLIDGDLRMPSLARYLGFDARKGFSDVLAGEISLVESIAKLQPAGLFLVPAGGERPDVAELLSGPRFGEILFEASQIFDFTIIDVPPISVFTDASVAINDADGALLVVRAGQTGYKKIERALETLPQSKMLGVVLNESEELMIGNSYYDYPYSKKY